MTEIRRSTQTYIPARVGRAVVAGLLGLLLAACADAGGGFFTDTSLSPAPTGSVAAAATPAPNGASNAATDPPAGGCHLRGALPDPACTPGATDPAVTQANIGQTICVSGYTARVRPPSDYTTALKVEQMHAYGLSGTTADFEEDHLIPLELGGAPRDPKNLWPQPRSGTPGASQKDTLENSLHAMVCSGRLPLAVAQQAIATDWVAASSPARPAPSPTAVAPSTAAVRNVPCGTRSTTTVATTDGGISMTVSYTCYDATGSTAQEIRAAMNANPARPVDQGEKQDAFTRWESRLEWSYGNASGTCVATSVAPTLEITFTFPRWVPPASPSPGVIQQWSTYLDALQVHENGHQQNGIDATSDAVGGVRAVRTASCAELNAAASQAVQSALKLGNEADTRYDTVTRHGATQGAVFP